MLNATSHSALMPERLGGGGLTFLGVQSSLRSPARGHRFYYYNKHIISVFTKRVLKLEAKRDDEMHDKIHMALNGRKRHRPT